MRIRPRSRLEFDQEQILRVIPSHARSLIEELQGKMLDNYVERGLSHSLATSSDPGPSDWMTLSM